ncbi:hypothetical protein [Azospirillum himalayense]|uniref:PglD N-terminal domain-containing protein n=1 Tax=Azospirillum himalayense TaxID=654847 RepID=A0ABW0G170_9PROT
MKIAKKMADIPVSDEIYIFGAGRGGQIMFDQLKATPGAKVLGFIDNNKQGTLKGLPILSFQDFLAVRTENAQVVIASMFGHEMAAQLRRNGIMSFCNAYPIVAQEVERGGKRGRLVTAAAIVAVIVGAAVLLLR